MSTYHAYIKLRVEGDTMDEALGVAREVSTSICNEHFTDCAEVVGIKLAPDEGGTGDPWDAPEASQDAPGSTISDGLVPPYPPKSTGLFEVIAKYLKLKEIQVSAQHLQNTRLILQEFAKYLGGYSGKDVPLGVVDREQVANYREDRLSRGRSITTVNTHVTTVVAFLRWAQAEGHAGGMGLTGLTLRQPSGRRASNQRAAFTDAEMQLVIGGLERLGHGEGHKAAVWIPRIMAYSGARPEEIAQLRGKDVRYEPDLSYKGPGGRAYLVFDFTAVDEGQRHKNESSRRLVPVHEALLPDLYTMAKIAGEGVLFPELQLGASGRLAEAPSRWFNRRWLKDRCGIKDPRKVLYSLRHTVATKLKHKGVEESLIAELLGHTNASMTTGRYGKSYPLENLAKAVALIEYT